jgi:hypothetical protein
MLASWDGAFMEPRGCNWWQSAANRRGRGSAENKPKPLPWVATGCPPKYMVRRGSTVRVRQRALQRPREDSPLPERVGFRNSVRVRGFSSSTRSAADSVSPGYQRVISRDLCAARQTNRGRLTSTRRIWYSRARVKPMRAYRRAVLRKGAVEAYGDDRRSGCVLVLVDQPAEQVPAI